MLDVKKLYMEALREDEPNDFNNPKCVFPASGLPDMSKRPLYCCPVCHEKYNTLEEAIACRDQPYDTGGFEVGDLLIIPNNRYYDGDRVDTDWVDHWIAFREAADPDSNSHFDRVSYVHPWWVITDIHEEKRHDPHRALVTVATMVSGRIWAGWNPATCEDHHAMFYPGRPLEEQCEIVASKKYYTYDKNGPLMQSILNAKPSGLLAIEAVQLAMLGLRSFYLL